MRHAFLLVVAACPSSGNPDRLWLAPDQNETHVKLVDKEPNPY